MNVYDFDKTIYYDDSTTDFYFYCLRRFPKTWLYIPCLVYGGIGYGLHLMSKTQMKGYIYTFLRGVKDVDKVVEQFWDAHEHKIKKWYRKQQRADDVIISASPEFLLKPICKRLHIQYLIASEVDPKTGKILGENCWGPQKVVRFKEKEYYGEVDEFYSDSYSDDPLAQLAKRSYLVQGDQRVPW